MVRRRPSLPAGHGELLLRPPFSEWAGLAEANHAVARTWEFTVAGVGAREVRDMARREFLQRAAEFSERLGVPVAAPGDPSALIAATGHQTELYHPGVWVKDFLLQRFADETGASAVDVMVDSDGFDSVAITAPCLVPEVRRCRQTLAVGTAGGWFASASVPRRSDIDAFADAALGMLETLPAPAVRRHFATFATHLATAADDADNLAEFLTFARRRYEAEAGTDYLELPVTSLVRGDAFTLFVAQMALDAPRFAAAYNEQLQEYRELTRTRSSAQPFPDLEVDDSGVELPLWALTPEGRVGVRARVTAEGVELCAGERCLIVLPAEPGEAARAIAGCSCALAPKALALTLYVRLFCCDLFIHGVGGGRYDSVTDGVIRAYFGVEPPAFTVASLTMYLPLGSHVVSDEEVAAAKDRLNRLDHNPDALLDEVDFDTEDERRRAFALAEEKRALVASIAAPDADKKSLGRRIKEVNTELAAILAPLRQGFEAEIASLEAQREASEIVTDRTYPFCLWSPGEVADKVR